MGICTHTISIFSLLILCGQAVAADQVPVRDDAWWGISTGRRVVVDATQAPWRAIGRLNKSGLGYCTAFLVGPSTIATAAHCLWNKYSKRNFLPTDLHFLAGYQRGEYLAHAKGVRIRVNPKFIPGREPVPANVVNDWAFVQLDRPLGDMVGFFEISPMSAAELVKSAKEAAKPGAKTQIAQAGYSKDFRYVITANQECRLARVENFNLVAHNCEVFNGDSGSPILMITGKSARVVALHVATGEAPDRRFGLAVPAGSFGATGGAVQ